MSNMFDALSETFIAAILNSAAFKQHVDKAVADALEDALDQSLGETVHKAVEEHISELNVERTCEEAVEEAFRNYTVTPDNIEGFDEAVCDALKGAL